MAEVAVKLELDGVEVRRGAFRLGPVTRSFGPGLWRVGGPNGAGKTTLFRALVGELPLTSGAVRVDGRPVDAAARRHLGFSPVDPELPDFLGVEEAWRMLAALRGRPGDENVARARAWTLPGGTRLGACSAGMRRKAELLAAFAGEPDVLLLDEPFANLDHDAVVTLAAWLAAWRSTRTILLTHHGELPLEADGAWALA